MITLMLAVAALVLVIGDLALHVFESYQFQAWLRRRQTRPFAMMDDFQRTPGWGTPGTPVEPFPMSDEVASWADQHQPYDQERDGG